MQQLCADTCTNPVPFLPSFLPSISRVLPFLILRKTKQTHVTGPNRKQKQTRPKSKQSSGHTYGTSKGERTDETIISQNNQEKGLAGLWPFNFFFFWFEYVCGGFFCVMQGAIQVGGLLRYLFSLFCFTSCEYFPPHTYHSSFLQLLRHSL